MKKNVGGIDRILRMVIGLGILVIAVYYTAWWGVFGLIIFLTGALSRCMLYKPFHFSTYKKKAEPEASDDEVGDPVEDHDDETMVH